MLWLQSVVGRLYRLVSMFVWLGIGPHHARSVTNDTTFIHTIIIDANAIGDENTEFYLHQTLSASSVFNQGHFSFEQLDL